MWKDITNLSLVLYIVLLCIIAWLRNVLNNRSLTARTAKAVRSRSTIAGKN